MTTQNGHAPAGAAESPAPAVSPKPQRPIRSHRRPAPTVIQMESVECGAAALAMVLASYGTVVPLEEMRVACGVTRDGANAANLLRAARRYGFVAHGYKMEPDEVATVVKPAIVFWAFQHFLVVEGVRHRFGRITLLLNDPAHGRREMSWEEFDAGFTGIVLTFEPGPDHVPDRTRRGVTGLLRGRGLGRPGALVPAIAAGLLLALPGVLVPTMTGVFVEQVVQGHHAIAALPLLVVLLAAALLTGVLTSMELGQSLRVAMAASLRSSARLVRRMMRLPLSFFAQRRPAELAKRLSAVDDVAESATAGVARMVVDVGVVAIYAAVLLLWDPVVAAVGFGLAAVHVLLLDRIARSRADSVAKLRAEEGNLAATTFNSLAAIETVKASGVEHDVFARWSGFQAKVVSGRQRAALRAAVLGAVPVLLAGTSTGLMLLVGGLRVIDGALSIGTLVAVQALVATTYRPVRRVSGTVGRWHALRPELARLQDVERHPLDPALEHADDAAGSGDAGRSARLNGWLEVRDLRFGYAPFAPPLVDGVSFSVLPGERVALVGGSGSGKSTIGRLVAGLCDPWSGEIVVGGQRRGAVDRATLAVSVAYVDQDVFLVEGTVRENLTLWDDSVPDDAVVAALRDAAMYDELAARPGGLTGMVAEGGRNFSGGQRQRLAIARALVREPTLLVLDEAMSALDAETERIVDDNLRRRGCACLIIAHRLSTVRDADEILVLSEGDIVQRGRHRRLIAEDGPYSELIRAAQ